VCYELARDFSGLYRGYGHRIVGRPGAQFNHAMRGRDQVESADAAVGRIKRDPARAGHIEFCPGMGRPRIARSHALLLGIVEIAGDDPRTKSETARTG
jgi:hypothetical protein